MKEEEFLGGQLSAVEKRDLLSQASGRLNKEKPTESN
jgi:hypothetical protein